MVLKGSSKYTLNEVKDYLSQYNYTFLEKEFINVSAKKLKVECPNNHIIFIKFSNFKRGIRCRKCYDEGINSESKILTQDTIKNLLMIKFNCELIKIIKEGNNYYVYAKCLKGHIWRVVKSQLKKAKYCGLCYKEKNKGETHHNWNPNRDRAARKDSGPLTLWSRKVKFRDKYTCQKCLKKFKWNNNKNLHAHHIKDFATNKALRLDISNGISLCQPCHSRFHSLYGSKNINEVQLQEFLSEIL
jgi:5-methylcytosine-specific restriction endonuclease McrA